MTRPQISPIVPRTEQEFKIYHGNLALQQIDAFSQLGETVLNSYHDQEPLGMGADKVVYPLPGQDDLAIAFYKKRNQQGENVSTDELKKRYYTIKLMHVLLPENIPDAHLLGSDPPMMHVDKVDAQPVRFQDFFELYTQLRDKAAKLAIFLDPKQNNFLLGTDGKLKYVDDFGLPTDFEKILNAINAIEDPDTRKRALRYAERAQRKLHSS